MQRPKLPAHRPVLSYAGTAQLLPVVLFGLRRRRFTAPGRPQDCACTAIVLGPHAAGRDPRWGVNGKLFAPAANVVVTAAISAPASPREVVRGGAFQILLRRFTTK